MTTPDIWGIRELATHYKVTRETIRQWRHRGLLPPPDVSQLRHRPLWWARTIRAHPHPTRKDTR